MSTKKSSQARKKVRDRRRLLLIVLIVLLVAMAAVLCVLLLSPPKDTSGGVFFDPNAQTGVMPGKSEEERKAELDKIVQEGMFNISIASVVVVESDGVSARLRIENIAANHHHMSVSIRLDGSEQTVYESGGLSPGQYIDNGRLSKKLAPGEYNATAVFTAHNMDTLEEEGTAAAKIRLVVLSKPR